MEVTVNTEQRLYVIPCGDGYSCLGFDVAFKLANKYATWLKNVVGMTDVLYPYENLVGTIAGYVDYRRLADFVVDYCKRKGVRCDVELTPELIGLEGKRVEVVDCYNEKRRFYVGKSTGLIPVHLEIARVDSTGGGGVYGTPFKSVKVVGTKTRR